VTAAWYPNTSFKSKKTSAEPAGRLALSKTFLVGWWSVNDKTKKSHERGGEGRAATTSKARSRRRSEWPPKQKEQIACSKCWYPEIELLSHSYLVYVCSEESTASVGPQKEASVKETATLGS
jgi:hypothetical protein